MDIDIDFSSPGSAREGVNGLLQKKPGYIDTGEIELREDGIFKDLFNAAVILKDKVSWTKNLGIENKRQEAAKFREAWGNDERYDPRFEFSSFNGNPRSAIKLLSALNRECTKIDKQSLREYNVETLSVEDLRNLYRGIFEEFKINVQVAGTINNRNAWQKNCTKLWPMNEDIALESKRKLINNSFKGSEEEKNLEAPEVKQIWEEELERMGLDYNVEVRNVEGCFNIPEEETVVVANGKNGDRLYSGSEAQMLTIHELFHVVRSYNGKRVCEKSGFPPIIGMHTPFYDKVEEGGAVHREFKTGVITSSKEKDYYLRTVAAYYTHQGLDFYDIVEKLVKLGARPSRAYGLAARNREILRHHIYLEGRSVWQNREELWPLMIGKINTDWAEKLKKEVEAEEGMLGEPPVKPEDVFEDQFS